MPQQMPGDGHGSDGKHVQAQRELVDAVGDRDHIAAYHKAMAVLLTRRLHPLRAINGVMGMRNLVNMELPDSVRMASPLHPDFPEYVGRKVAESVSTEMRNLAAIKPYSRVAELVRDRDMFTTSMYLIPAQDGRRLPKGCEAAEIAAGLAGTYIREPALNEAGQRGYITYTPAGLVYGSADKVFEDHLREAAYTMTPPAVSPFVPESELDIYGGQPNFLGHESRLARQQTAASLLGIAATRHLTE